MKPKPRSKLFQKIVIKFDEPVSPNFELPVHVVKTPLSPTMKPSSYNQFFKEPRGSASKMTRITKTLSEKSINTGSRTFRGPFYVSNKKAFSRNTNPVSPLSDNTKKAKLPDFKLKSKTFKDSPRNKSFDASSSKTGDTYYSCLQFSKLENNEMCPSLESNSKSEAKEEDENFQETIYLPPLLPIRIHPLDFQKISEDDNPITNKLLIDDYNQLIKSNDEEDSLRQPKIPSSLKTELEKTMYALQNKLEASRSNQKVLEKGEGENQNSSHLHHISFHYETNGDLNNLTPTGVSMDYPSSNGQVSSYFPINRNKQQSQSAFLQVVKAINEKMPSDLSKCGPENIIVNRKKSSRRKKSKNSSKRKEGSDNNVPRFNSYYRDLSDRIRNSIHFNLHTPDKSRAELLKKYGNASQKDQENSPEDRIVMTTKSAIGNVSGNKKLKTFFVKSPNNEMFSDSHEVEKHFESPKKKEELKNGDFVSLEEILKMSSAQLPPLPTVVGKAFTGTRPIKPRKISKPHAHDIQVSEEHSTKADKPVQKAKSSLTARKWMKLPTDNYFMNASESEKEIIKELVKADVEAMLERDAVALLSLTPDVSENPSIEMKPSKIAQEPTRPPAAKKAELATHWSYRLYNPSPKDNRQTTPLPAGKTASRSRNVGKKLELASSQVSTKTASRPTSRNRIRASKNVKPKLNVNY